MSMADQTSKWVGKFIRERREAAGLSQRALGQLFTPPVTTQFISNIERGVTPLPPVHIPTLSNALKINEAEITNLMEREYTHKLSQRLGRTPQADGGMSPYAAAMGASTLPVTSADYPFMRNLYDAYSRADEKTREAFATVCISILKLPGSGSSSSSST